MEKYTIYCTTEQAEKALSVYAPIKVAGTAENTKVTGLRFEKNGVVYKIPTADQMRGWLREVGINVHVGTPAYVYDSWESFIQYSAQAKGEDGKTEYWWLEPESFEIFDTYEDAMMHAIDAALDYLVKEEEHIEKSYKDGANNA